MIETGVEIDKLIADAASRVHEAKQEQEDNLRDRRTKVIDRVKTAILNSPNNYEEETAYSVCHRASNLRISQAEALADLVERGIVEEIPYWWDVKKVWSGYTRPGRKRVRLCTTDSGSLFKQIIDTGDVLDFNFPVRIDITVRQTCRDRCVAVLFPPSHRARAIFAEAREEQVALARAYIRYFSSINPSIDSEFNNISNSLKKIIDRIPISEP